MISARAKPRITDAALCELIRINKKEGAEILYDAYADFLFLAIIRIVKERELAKNVLQVTFVKAWRSIDSYKIENEKFYSWIIVIARVSANEALLTKDQENDDKTIKSI